MNATCAKAWRVTVRRTNGYFVYLFTGPLRKVAKNAKRNNEIIVAVELHNQDEVMRCLP